LAAIIVHCLSDCVAALTAASRTGRAVSLLSPPDGGASLGIGYFTAMLAEAHQLVPGTGADAVLDCGDSPGLALSALQAGIAVVRLAAAGETLRRLDDIAGQLGARVERHWPVPVLDLADRKDPLAAALAYLSGS